jgi:hypothetical protein
MHSALRHAKLAPVVLVLFALGFSLTTDTATGRATITCGKSKPARCVHTSSVDTTTTGTTTSGTTSGTTTGTTTTVTTTTGTTATTTATTTTNTTTTGTTTSGTTTSTGGGASGPAWGMAGGYTSTQLADLAGRGIRVTLVEMSWARAEPQDGVWDEAYFDSVRSQAASMRALGLKPILNFGLHHAPPWLLAKAGARFVNEHGAPYTATDEANLVFARDLRGHAEQYLGKLFTELGSDWYAIRVGGGHWGELQYPAQKGTDAKWQWWAFDQNALAQSPVPSYRPCGGSQAEAATFLGWYLDALSEFQNWQVSSVRRYYAGPIAVLYASWGMRGGDFDKAAAANLCGTSSAEINGEVQRGYDHARHVGAVTDPGVAVWGTWAEQPGTISYLAGLADAKGLAKMGENSGSDDLVKMAQAVTAAKQYGLRMLLWIRASETYCACNGYASVDDLTALTR